MPQKRNTKLVDYRKWGKIYIIVCRKTKQIYVGSTGREWLEERMRLHRTDVNCKTKTGFCSSKEIINGGDYWFITIELYPCNSKRELELRETEHYLKYKRIYGDLCVNAQTPRHTKESFTEYNNARSKIYKKAHPEVGKLTSARYYEKNKDELKMKNDARKDKVCICEYCHQQKSYASYARHRSLCFAKTCESMNHINIF